MRFEVLEGSLELDGVSHTIYGVVCIDDFDVCHTFSDLTDNREAIKNFVDKLNALCPEISQLEYLIEDFCAVPI